MTNAEAQAHFQDFNQRFFGGKLPKYRVRVADYITKVREQGRINRKSRLIRLSAGYDEASTIAILVHEMAHAATYDEHAARFINEMKRLVSVGAPITYESDIRGYEEPLGPKRLTRAFLRSTAEDAIMDAPTIPFRAFVRWFIRDYGYAKSSAQFMRRFPWASRIFREVKKNAKAYEKQRAEFLERDAAHGSSRMHQ